MWRVRAWAFALGLTSATLFTAFAVARPWYDLVIDAALMVFAAARLRKAREAR